MNILCFVSVIWIALSITIRVDAQAGCATLAPSACAGLNGILDGGRCFFIVNENCTNWDDSWTRCDAHGGIMAQLHSDSEFNRVAQLATTRYSPLAARDQGRIVFFLPVKFDAGYDGTSMCDESRMNHVYWYDSVTSKSIPPMGPKNTWFQNHICDDSDVNAETVFRFQLDGSGTPSIKDTFWNASLHMPLCMTNTFEQSYTQSSGICITALPLETITPVQQPQECADACTARLWCRSFNFVTDSINCNDRHCELFSRSILDTSTYRVNTTVANGDCFHYNYVP